MLLFLFFCTFLMNAQSSVFWASAWFGTALFVIRMLMMFVGDLEHHDVSADAADAVEHHDDSTSSFKLLTLHSFSGFLMIFGWVGLACREQFHMPPGYSWSIAMVCGVAMMVLTALLVRAARRFESRGSVFNIGSMVGLTGSVYQRIPDHAKGKVQVVANGVTRELLARSVDNKAIDSFVLVKIIAVVDHETVEVMPIK